MQQREVVAALGALRETDPREAHSAADKLPVDFLRAAGYGEVARAFEQAEQRVGFLYG